MTGWLVETLVATTLLMALILLVRGHVAQRFGARIAYLLWLLPPLRMVLPPLPESFGAPPLAHVPVIIDISALVEMDGAAGTVTAEPGFPWGTMLLALWLAGALVHLAWHLIAYRRFVREALRDRIELPELDMRGIEVCASRIVEGPFAAGIFLPTIVLPHDYRTRYTAEELRLAMRHEAIHHERGDISVNLLALAMLSLHWFNPIAYRAWRAFRADQELACDALVLDSASQDERHSYGVALVKSACNRTPVAACSLNPRNQLKQRLKMMNVRGERRISGMMLAGMVVGGGLFATASGGIAAETTRNVQREVSWNVIAPAVRAVGIVQPPVAPAPPVPARPSAPPAPPPPPAEPLSKDVEAALEQSAMQEALNQAEAGRREAREAVRQAQADVRRAQIISNGMLIQSHAGRSSGDCDEGTASVAIRADAAYAQRTRISVCGAIPDRATITRITLDAMVQARAGMARNIALDGSKRAIAMAAMDREIARLTAERDTIH